MSEMTVDEFLKLTKDNPHTKEEWNFDLFKIKCNKCSSENVEVNGKAESEGGYYRGEHSLTLRIFCKCHDCGNFMGVNGDCIDFDESFIYNNPADTDTDTESSSDQRER